MIYVNTGIFETAWCVETEHFLSPGVLDQGKGRCEIAGVEVSILSVLLCCYDAGVSNFGVTAAVVERRTIS